MILADRVSKRLTRLGLSAYFRLYSFIKDNAWQHSGTSITDKTPYVDFCAHAASNEAAFKSFRSKIPIRPRPTSDTRDSGRYYLANILQSTLDYKNFFDRAQSNDNAGSPIAWGYPPHGRFAPDTLRYLKYLADCEVLFGSLDSKTVAEIGGGYGGLCKLFLDRFHIQRYYFIELPEVIALAKRYLTTLLGANTIKQKVVFVDARNPIELSTHLKTTFFDLTVSTAAFSECESKMQKLYVDYVLNKSTHGYLILNDLGLPFGVPMYSQAALSRMLYKDIYATEDPAWWWDDRVTLWTWRP